MSGLTVIKEQMGPQAWKIGAFKDQTAQQNVLKGAGRLLLSDFISLDSMTSAKEVKAELRAAKADIRDKVHTEREGSQRTNYTDGTYKRVVEEPKYRYYVKASDIKKVRSALNTLSGLAEAANDSDLSDNISRLQAGIKIVADDALPTGTAQAGGKKGTAAPAKVGVRTEDGGRCKEIPESGRVFSPKGEPEICELK